MRSISLLFPHQLFDQNPVLSGDREIWMIEEPLFFTQYKFHKLKLVYHRATMRAYLQKLIESGYSVRYFEFHEADTCRIFETAVKEKITDIFLTDPTDYLLERRYRRQALKNNIQLHFGDSPLFLSTRQYGATYFEGSRKFFLTSFYIDQRKRFGILLENGEPSGGKWTFDSENRKKLPKGISLPKIKTIQQDHITNEAIRYVNNHFSHHPGKCGPLIYPYSRKDALSWLKEFIHQRFSLFGEYQDAIDRDKNFLYHSMLTPMLNVGLLTPGDILEQCIQQKGNPVNSTEGFIRQILGWREFIRHVYELRGTQQRTANYWNHQRKIPQSFYNGTTGIEPVDNAIRRCLDDAYTHHIERLMVLGNFMVLCEFNPDEVYQWFMELFIDSYDWVMVPNVYGMSQYADGGIMSTKPYISGSNYILKMSNYKKGAWSEIWDALFWRFIHKHKNFFLKNPRMSMMVRQVEKMDQEKFDQLMRTAEAYLLKLDTGNTSVEITFNH